MVRNFTVEHDPAELFFATRCQKEPDASTRFSDLLHEFKNWIVLHGHSPRRYTRAFLKEEVLHRRFSVGTRQGYLMVDGLKLVEERAVLPEARLGWKEVRALDDTDPEAARELPIELGYGDLRRLPPDEYTWQRFTEECVDPSPVGRRVPGTSIERYNNRIFVRWDVLCSAFWKWLGRQSASSGVRSHCDRKWLFAQVRRHHLEHRTIYGTIYILGMALRGEWDEPHRYASQRENALRRSSGNEYHHRVLLEAKAKQEQGMTLNGEEQATLDDERRRQERKVRETAKASSKEAPAAYEKPKLRDLPNGRLFARFWNERCVVSATGVLGIDLLAAWRSWLQQQDVPDEAGGEAARKESLRLATIGRLSTLVYAAGFLTYGNGRETRFFGFSLR